MGLSVSTRVEERRCGDTDCGHRLSPQSHFHRFSSLAEAEINQPTASPSARGFETYLAAALVMLTEGGVT